MSEPFLTRKEVPQYVKKNHGIPVSKSAVEKLAAQGRLKADKYYGPAHLYRPATVDKFAKGLISDHPANLGLNQPSAEPDPEAA